MQPLFPVSFFLVAYLNGCIMEIWKDVPGYIGILWRYIPILLLCGANGVGKDEPPDVTDTPGVRYAVTESDFW